MNETLPDLLSGISSEAQNESEQLKAEAAKNRDQKLASAKMLETRLIEESRVKGEKQALQIRKSAESALSVERAESPSKEKNVCFQKILKEVRQRFSEYSESPGYSDLLVGWICEAAIGLGVENIVIYASSMTLSVLTPALLKKAEQAVADTIGEKVTFSCVLGDTEGLGVLLKDQSGRLVYDNRLEARLQRYDKRIRGMIAREFLQE